MPFDRRGLHFFTNDDVLSGATVRLDKSCTECGGNLALKHVVKKLQDVVWPSGAASGRGQTRRVAVEFCQNCDAEPSDEVETDPAGWQKRMAGQD